MGPLMMSRPMSMAAAACGAFIAVFLALIWTMQRRLIYFPTSGVPTPAEIGLTDVERVTFETTDGLRLSGWFVAASGTSPRVTVVVFHGNAGNPGTPTERGLAAGWSRRPSLSGRSPRRRSVADRVLRRVAGNSRGGRPRRRAPAGSARSAIAVRIDGRRGATSLSFLAGAPASPGPLRGDDQIKRVRVPLLIIAGGDDTIVPVEHSRHLYDAPTAPKTILVFPDADHNDDELLAGGEMVGAIVRFLLPLT